MANDVLEFLTATVPGSTAALRGSLADGTADVYSDIDIRWDVPAADFPGNASTLRSVLEQLRPIESLRSDPDVRGSPHRRLYFVRFEEVPLFWRVDLDVYASSVARDEICQMSSDTDGTAWSPTESALMNVVAALKAHLRQDDDTAHALLARAYRRMGLPVPDLALRLLAVDLVNQVTGIDPEVAPLGQRISQLAEAVFRQE